MANGRLPFVCLEESDGCVFDQVREFLSLGKGFRGLANVQPPPDIDWDAYALEVESRETVPRSAIRWWNELVAYGENTAKLAVVLTPETAESLFEIADGSSGAEWYETVPEAGDVFALSCDETRIKVEKETSE